MAGRLKSNQWFRVVHLYSSLFLFTMLLMYVLTGFIMSRYKWFPYGKDEISTSVLPLNYLPDTTNLEELGDKLKQQFEISGRTDYFKNDNHDIRYSIIRPGVKYTLVVHNNLDSITIKKVSKETFQEIGTRIHRLFGFKGSLLYKIWAILLDFTAIAAILFSLTGIVLWLRIKNMRRFGLLILASTTIWGVIMIYYLW